MTSSTKIESVTHDVRAIPVYQPDLSGNESAYVNECLTSGWVSSRGAFIERFEHSFRDYIGAQHAISVCNGTVAIQVALAALGVGPGDEVIVPSLTYIASVNSIVILGAVPVFADSDATTMQLDPAELERLRTPRTKAVFPVHLYGHACDMRAICAWAKVHGIWVIEDCAESFGATLDGQHTGTFGDAATFSFFGNKTITTGEGGMVVFRERSHRDAGFAYKTQGVSPTRTYWHDRIGFNFRMTNIEAAIGLAQLERADATLARKRELAHHYERALRGLPIRFAKLYPGVVSSYWMIACVVEKPALRDGLMSHLSAHAVDTRPFFHPAHVLPMYLHAGVNLPRADELAATGLNLPSWPGLTAKQVDRVCDLIREYLTAHGAPAS